MVVCHLYDAFTNSHRLIFKLAALIITTTASSWLFWLVTGTHSTGMWRHPPACIPSTIINLISHLLLCALSLFIKQGEATVEAGAGTCLCETKPFIIPVCRFHIGGNVKTEDQRRRHQRQNWDWEAFEVMYKVTTRAGQDAIARQCLEMFWAKGEAAWGGGGGATTGNRAFTQRLRTIVSFPRSCYWPREQLNKHLTLHCKSPVSFFKDYLLFIR